MSWIKRSNDLEAELRYYKLRVTVLEEQLRLADEEKKALKDIIDSLRKRLKYLESE